MLHCLGWRIRPLMATLGPPPAHKRPEHKTESASPSEAESAQGRLVARQRFTTNPVLSDPLPGPRACFQPKNGLARRQSTRKLLSRLSATMCWLGKNSAPKFEFQRWVVQQRHSLSQSCEALGPANPWRTKRADHIQRANTTAEPQQGADNQASLRKARPPTTAEKDTRRHENQRSLCLTQAPQ